MLHTLFWRDEKSARLVKFCASNLARCSYAYGKSLQMAAVLIMTHQPSTLQKASEANCVRACIQESSTSIEINRMKINLLDQVYLCDWA